MTELANAHLPDWASFFVIVGSAGAALIGIQFVVITLVASLRPQATPEGIHTFSTPTVVYFSGAMVVSAVMTVPWRSLTPLSALLVLCGVGGLLYALRIILRARQQTGYTPVWQDWLYYAWMPCAIDVTLAIGGGLLPSRAQTAMLIIAIATLGLLLLGVHNSWDTVTHMVTHPEPKQGQDAHHEKKEKK